MPSIRCFPIRAKRLLLGLVTLALFAAPRSVPAQSIVSNFEGISYTDIGSRLTPPDTMGAVGIDDVVMFCNGGFAVYDKGGTRKTLQSDSQFWLNAGVSNTILLPGLSDPRITFDPTVNRWFATEMTLSASNNRILVARSDTADPTAAWKATSYVGATNRLADYDTLGVDARNIYVGTNNYNLSTNQLTSLGMTVIPKADILAATPTVANRRQVIDTSGTLGWPPRGVTNYSGDPGHGVLMAINVFNWATTTRLTVNGSGTGATISAPTNISTLFDVADGPTNPAQPGGTTIDVVDDRYTSAITQVGDNIYMTNTVISNGRDAIHWLVTSELTNAIVGEGVIADPAYDFLQPSIGVNGDGTFLLGFNRVGTSATTGNISIYGAIGKTSGTGISVGSPFRLQQGVVANFTGPAFDTGTSKRWGDYSATVVDPTNANLFWTFQEIPSSTTAWTTRVVAVAVPEPTTCASLLAGLGFGVLSMWRRRRRA